MCSDSIDEMMRELLKWERIQGLRVLRELLPRLLDDEKKRRVYELTDGSNSQSSIAKQVGVAGGTISNWWNTWYSHGIVTKEGNRYQKLMSLKELKFGTDQSEKKGE